MKNSGSHQTKKRNKLNEIDWKILQLKLSVEKNEKIEFYVIFLSVLRRSDQVFNSVRVFLQLLQITAIKIYTTSPNFGNVDTKHEIKSDFFFAQQPEIREIKCEFYGLSYQIMRILMMFQWKCMGLWMCLQLNIAILFVKGDVFCRRIQKNSFYWLWFFFICAVVYFIESKIIAVEWYWKMNWFSELYNPLAVVIGKWNENYTTEYVTKLFEESTDLAI